MPSERPNKGPIGHTPALGVLTRGGVAPHLDGHRVGRDRHRSVRLRLSERPAQRWKRIVLETVSVLQGRIKQPSN